ncbi:IclR family transcriptional regulator [Serinibacter salmoneus]|uniref:IclR family transcriptional regulator n=1 Tax=Serinibacter salmoneus TaxID=556530 RepID=A0A2A9D2N3_9MICO|nr:IclR family transcriptional regulator [Serinibacter salmoneus]PFG20641.1 IclR family transcriptional regulator [Serinibacter salmoneus]
MDGVQLTAGEKTLVVLEKAIEHRRFTDIVAATGLAKATVHRILGTLVERGFLAPTPEGDYLPGPRFLSLTGRAFEEIDIARLVEPLAADLASQVHCTVHVGARVGDEVVYLVRADSDKPYRMPSRVGATIPMNTSGIGKSILAQVEDSEVMLYASRAGLVRRTARTLSTVEDLLAELHDVRREGFSFDREENVPGVVCIAAPIWDHTGRCMYGLSISTLALEHDEDQLRAMAPELLTTAAAMSAVLGGAAPSHP